MRLLCGAILPRDVVLEEGTLLAALKLLDRRICSAATGYEWLRRRCHGYGISQDKQTSREVLPPLNVPASVS